MSPIVKAGIVLALAGAALLAGCGVPAQSPGTATPIAKADGENASGSCSTSYGGGILGGPRREQVVHYQDATFKMVESVRADALDGIEQLVPTGLVQSRPTEGDITAGSQGCPVLSIEGRPISDGYAIKEAFTRYPGHCTRSADPYLVFGVSDAPFPPSRRGTPTPTVEGVPSPRTPTPHTPTPVQLSEAGLLAAGWPHLDWNRLEFLFEGETFQPTSWYVLDPSDPFPADRLTPIQTINIHHAPEVNLPTGFPELALKGEVTDELRLYKVSGEPPSDALIIDACPMDMAVDSYMFFQVTG